MTLAGIIMCDFQKMNFVLTSNSDFVSILFGWYRIVE